MKLLRNIILFTLVCLSCTHTQEKYEYYDSAHTVIMSKSTLKNGVMHGKSVRYYESGKIYDITYWENGMLNGTTEKFDEQGRLLQKHEFINNKRISAEFYYPNGKLKSKWLYDNNESVYDRKDYDESGLLHPMQLTVGSDKDSVLLGDSIKIVARLNNVEDTVFYGGKLIVGTELTEEYGEISDTLMMCPRIKNLTDFKYKPEKKGDNFIYIQVTVPIPIERNGMKGDSIIMYIQKHHFYVKE